MSAARQHSRPGKTAGGTRFLLSLTGCSRSMMSAVAVLSLLSSSPELEKLLLDMVEYEKAHPSLAAVRKLHERFH